MNYYEWIVKAEIVVFVLFITWRAINGYTDVKAVKAAIKADDTETLINLLTTDLKALQQPEDVNKLMREELRRRGIEKYG